MSDDNEGLHARGFGFEIPAHVVAAMTQSHDNRRVQAQDRSNLTMRWLDELSVEGLLAVRWILSCDADEAYANNKFFDGMCVQQLRSRGVDPYTGLDPTAQLLEEEALRSGGQPQD